MIIFEDQPELRTIKSTLVGFNDSQIDHKNTIHQNHPESSDRISKIKQVLTESGLLDQCHVATNFLEIDEQDLRLTHEQKMISTISSTSNMSQTEIDNVCSNFDSVFMTKDSFSIAKEGVACVRELTHQIIHNNAQNGFAIVRPPGHHADSQEPCGFCIFNNAAQAAEEAFLNGADRILIVDLDVHHGQGTQRQFYDDKRVLYFSIHRYEYGTYWPHLPESDFDHIGKDAGVGFNANLPLNEIGCGDSDYLSILWHVLLPLATQFDPHFVIISAGFDSLNGDPLGKMKLSPNGYSHIVYHLKCLAQGRLLMILEGGYNHEISSIAAHRCLRVLLGHPPLAIQLNEPPKESTINSCINLITALRNFWTCFDYFPTKSSMRLGDWPIVNPTVIYNYNPEKREEDTKDIQQTSLEQINWKTNLKNTSEKVENLQTLIYFNEGDDKHCDDPDENHPENPERTKRIIEKLGESHLIECKKRKSDRVATNEEILMVHTKDLLENLEKTKIMTDEELDNKMEKLDSIYLTRDTLNVALQAVGTLLECVDEILTSKGEKNAFAVIRPPGHHASSSKSSGFCIFNNVAIATRYAQQKYKIQKVLILDWDVHHGNGTQEIFYKDENVLYMSIHRHDKGSFYPIGEPKDYFDFGENEGIGRTVNIPFSGGSMGDIEYQTSFTKIIMPIAYQFNPDLIFISSGFDAASNDPLGSYNVSPEMFALMTYQLSALASGRIIGVLEGGYNLNSIANSAQAVCEVLYYRSMIRRIGEEKEQHAINKKKLKTESIRSLRDVCSTQSKHWNHLKGFQVIPSSLGLIEEMTNEDQPTSSSSIQPNNDGSPGLHAVVPLSTCPHLVEVSPLPSNGINASSKCGQCNIEAEVWICLKCYEPNCGRFINEHALMHNLSSSHPMTLSLADLSVWCYPCNAYVHNEILIPAKSSAHNNKFGQPMPF